MPLKFIHLSFMFCIVSGYLPFFTVVGDLSFERISAMTKEIKGQKHEKSLFVAFFLHFFRKGVNAQTPGIQR